MGGSWLLRGSYGCGNGDDGMCDVDYLEQQWKEEFSEIEQIN